MARQCRRSGWESQGITENRGLTQKKKCKESRISFPEHNSLLSGALASESAAEKQQLKKNLGITINNGPAVVIAFPLMRSWHMYY
jgi:hypothetical protein